MAAAIVIAGRRIVMRRGKWFAIYVAGYGVGRLWVEALRSDNATHILGLRVNTWTALVAIVGGLLWLFWGGNPVDREATRQLRAGVPESTLFAADVRHRDTPPSKDAAGDEPSTEDALVGARSSEDAAGSDATASEPTASEATGSEAPGSEASGSEATGAEASDKEPAGVEATGDDAGHRARGRRTSG